MSNRVNGHGPKNAKICIVGEAPGAEEEAIGLPFIGASGKFLNRLLSTAGINREECYCTNVIKTRPANNYFGVYYHDKKQTQPTAELIESSRELIAEINQIKPNVTIPVGNEALFALTGKHGITKWRGSMLSSPVGKCVPTYHPAAVLRQYSWKPIVELDLVRAQRESLYPDLRLPPTNFIIDPSYETVMDYLRTFRKDRFAFDIETLGDMTRCLAISHEVGHAICIPFVSSHRTMRPGTTRLFLSPEGSPTANSYWPPEQELAILGALDELFRRHEVFKDAQNCPFDTVIMAREFGFDFPSLDRDTMVMSHTAYPELPKGLDFLCSIYTRFPYYSDFDASNDLATWTYNCYDAAVTYEISPLLNKELDELGVLEFYHSHVHPTVLAASRTETRGILVDAALKEEERVRLKGEVEILEGEIKRLVGSPTFNPASPDQMKAYLYTTLRLPVQYKADPKTKIKKPTTDKHAREKLAKAFPVHGVFFQKVSEFADKQDYLSDFLNKPLSGDSCLRTHWWVAGADTGRWTSEKPLFDEGTNLQNIRRGKPRRMFISRPGKVLLKCDLMSAEFRDVMWEANIRKIITKYVENPFWDVHTWFASIAFNVPEDKVERKNPNGLSQRDRAKNGIYGGNYRMQPEKAALTYKVPLAEAKFILDRYRNVAVPEVQSQYWSKIERNLQATRTRINPIGRIRQFFDRLDDDCYRVAYADLPQSTVADIINRAFAILDDILPEDQCCILLQVHDEILLECDEDKVDYFAPIIRNVMEYPIYCKDTPEALVIPAEIQVGKNWYEMKEVERVAPPRQWPNQF